MKSAFLKNPILVIDRDGLIGEPLVIKLSKEFPVVFVSKRGLDLGDENQNINCVPFYRKFPVIPDSNYSHIIFLDEEGADSDFLPRVIDKVRAVNSDFIFAQGISAKGEYAIGKILRSYPSAKVALFGDVFGKELILREEGFRSVVNKFIYQAQKFGRIQVLGEGLRETHPVFLDDVVDGLMALAFGASRPHSLFYIFPKHATTELSLAHMIQKNNPEVTIDFAKHDPRLGMIKYPPNGECLLESKYPLAKKIREINIKKKATIWNKDFLKPAKISRNYPFPIIWILIFLLLFPLVVASSFSFLGLNTLYYAKGELGKGNFAHAKSSLRLSQAFFYVAKKTSVILFFQSKIIGRDNEARVFLRDLDMGDKISESLLQAFNSEIYFSKVLSGKSENPTGDFATGGNYLKNSMIALSSIVAEGKIPVPILQNFETVNPLIKLLSTTLDIMPSILGMEKPKTYLILFQNNMELRPGGGLISSYGVLKFSMGKITEFSLHDISEADKQLRGHIEPPFAIRRYLPGTHWYMKDSNFNVDFVKSASASSNFLFAETGQKVSGVIAVDTTFAKSILRAIGPVHVGGYREAINEGNLYMLAQSHREENFLRSLYGAIIAKMATGKTSYLLIAQAISDSLEQKHLMFAFDEWQNIFTANGWSSSLWDERRSSEESINDFVGINEANLGLNRANYFIKRQILHKVAIGDGGGVVAELSIDYKNEGSVLSGAEYKNYLRVILPKNVKLSEISINDSPQVIVDAITDPKYYEAENFKAPLGLEVERTNEGDKTIFGFLVKVPVEKIVRIKLGYALPGSILGLNAFSYSLKLFKQPGVENIPYSFSLAYPKSFNVIKNPNGIVWEEGRVFDSGRITGDKNLIINFARK